MLDGKFHKITVQLHNQAFDKQDLEIHYRSGYLATKIAVPSPPPTLAEIMDDPLVSSGIGLAARATLDPQHQGSYTVRVTVDLHDIHLDRKNGHFTGAFDVSVPDQSAKGSVLSARFAVDITDEQLAEALENGFTVVVKGAESESGEIRVVVRDRATGIAGSLQVPVAEH
jgi:hypothetical protein